MGTRREYFFLKLRITREREREIGREIARERKSRGRGRISLPTEPGD